jgi:cell wall-associated NlpC family hydrolase
MPAYQARHAAQPSRRNGRTARIVRRSAVLPAVTVALTGGALAGTAVATPAHTGAHETAAQRIDAGAVRWAHREIGKPYAYGADGPRSFDCSGLVKYVYGKEGLHLPHNAEEQYRVSHHRGSGYVRRWGWVQPGFLIFFGNSPSGIYHVGIYIGHHDMIAAPSPGQRVQVQNIWSNHVYAGHFG